MAVSGVSSLFCSERGGAGAHAGDERFEVDAWGEELADDGNDNWNPEVAAAAPSMLAVYP